MKHLYGDEAHGKCGLRPCLIPADNSSLSMDNKSYCDPETGKVLAERRSGVDRRVPKISMLFASRYRRRKSAGRREADHGGYVDIYDSRTWSITAAILILSLIDALLTRMLLRACVASELNPILNAVLQHGGVAAFFGVKAMLTIIPLSIIVLHKEWALGRYAALLCLLSYVLVSLYHLYLIFGYQRLDKLLRSVI